MVRETLQPGDICITHEVFLTLPAMIFRSQASDDSEACKQAVRGTKITNYLVRAAGAAAVSVESCHQQQRAGMCIRYYITRYAGFLCIVRSTQGYTAALS